MQGFVTALRMLRSASAESPAARLVARSERTSSCRRPFDPRYPVDWQYAFLVRGTSMNWVASDGDLLVCLDVVRSGEPARDGDVVVIERHRHGLHEVSARRITRTEHHTLFSYDLLDPKFINPEHPGHPGAAHRCAFEARRNHRGGHPCPCPRRLPPAVIWNLLKTFKERR